VLDELDHTYRGIDEEWGDEDHPENVSNKSRSSGWNVSEGSGATSERDLSER